MRAVIKFFIRNQLLVNLGIILIVILGSLAVSNMNSSFFPEIEERFIIIEATYPGSSPREVEEGITLKIEENLKSVTGIDRVTSVSRENIATITVELFYGEDADQVLQDVKNAVDQISTFPEGLERLVVFVRENENFTSKIAISGDVSLAVLKERAEKFEDELRDFDNISRIELTGFTEQEVEIALDEAKMRAYEITFEEVAEAVANENVQVTGGRIRADQEVIIRADQKQYRARQLRDLVVKSIDDGNSVYLSDVADIREDWAESTDASYYNNHRAIMITVNTLNQENILDAAASIRGYLDEFNKRNTVVQASMVEDGTDSLRERITLLEENGLIGALLVFVILTLFLRIRLAFWVAVGIPISFLGMFIVANMVGLTINVLSLFGMILVVGILVDDGIVVGENVYQHYERGESKYRAVVNGTMEVLPSILSAITTTCVAFAFFFFIDGQLGEFYSDVAVVVIGALGFSLLEVLLFLPAHLAHVKDLTPEAKPGKVKLWVENLLIKYRDYVFKPILGFVLKYKLFTILFCLSLLIVTMGALGGGVIESTFFPNIEQTKVTVTLEYPSGTAEHITRSTIRSIEDSAFALNDEYKNEFDKLIITDSELRVGPGSNNATATFYLVGSEKRPIRSFEVTTDLRAKVGKIPNATKLSFTTQTPFGKPLNVAFSGENFSRLRAAVNDFMREVRQTGMVKDLVTNDQADQPEIDIELNAAGRGLGFTTLGVIRQIRSGFFGYEAQRLQRGDDEVKVWVRAEMEDRNSLRNLEEFRVTSPSGNKVPLGEIVTMRPIKGLVSINHLDGKRSINVEGELASIDVSSTEMIQRVTSDIFPVIKNRYPDVSLTMEGQQRETRKLQSSIQNVGPIVLVLIAAILIITFRSLSQTGALLLTIPFGLIGAGWGHFIHGQPVSLLSLLGFIALIGVIINDGLVYVNTFNLNLQNGKSYDQALKETSISRFRPIFLTTITTAAGLGPLIFEKSFQAQFLIPMAISIAYGLIAGSIFLTLLLPIFMAFFNRLKVYFVWLWTGSKPTLEEVEKAVIRQRKKEEEYAEL